MPDNLQVPPMFGGPIIATDDVGGAAYQRVKIGLGADGLAADWPLGPVPMAQAAPVTIATDQTPIRIAPAGIIANGSIAAAGTVVTLDCQDAASVGLQITQTGNSLQFEASNDNTNWVSLAAVQASAAAATAAVSTTSSGAFYAAAVLRYFRVRVSTYVSGTITVNAISNAVSTDPASARTVFLGAGTGLAADVGLQARTGSGGGASIRHVVSAATTNAANVRAAAGKVLGWCLGNTSAAWRYVKLHNTAGTPTAGAGVVATIAIPPGQTVDSEMTVGLAFATGIGMSIVTGAADTDATAVGLNEVVGDIYYV